MEHLILALLGLASIISISVIIERALALRRAAIIPTEIIEAQRNYRHPEDQESLRALCHKHNSPYGAVLGHAIDHSQLPRTELIDTVQTRARQEICRMERGLVVIEIVTGIAPLLGLVGTIYGLILLFRGFDPSIAASGTKFADGISLALRATFMGLFIAIPSLAAWSYFNRKVESLSLEMESLVSHFLIVQRKPRRAQQP